LVAYPLIGFIGQIFSSGPVVFHSLFCLTLC
jgi:hypothetical protein